MANVQPRFEVYPVENDGLTRKVCKPAKNGGFTYEEVPETRECFDVYFLVVTLFGYMVEKN